MATPNGIGGKPIILSRVQRNVLRREITTVLAGNPPFHGFSYRDEEENLARRERMEMRFRLLDDLGWHQRDERDERDEFTVTVPRRALCEFLARERDELALAVQHEQEAVTEVLHAGEWAAINHMTGQEAA